MRPTPSTWWLLALLAACGDAPQPPSPAPDQDAPDMADMAADLEVVAAPPYDAAERSPGGAMTVMESGPRALMMEAPGISAAQRAAFITGQTVFEVDWLEAPHPQDVRDGLGPLYHATACSGCHFQNGRGAPSPGDGPVPPALLFRIGVADGAGRWAADPVYGGQLQPRALPGHSPEGRVRVSWREASGLLWPTYTAEQLGYGELAAGAVLGPRMAQPMVGLGLLEAVPEATILALADPDDRDGDGVSGRANWVDGRLGRFGWKANQASLLEQNAAALLGDMGLTTRLHPGAPCSPAQAACLAAASGGEPEIDDARLDALTEYTRLLGVPAARGEAGAGRALFYEVGCATCHVPSLKTDDAAPWPLGGQRIYAYTDLLLHDMGEGLADGLPDHEASGREWRTAPLWGIGLTRAVSGHTRLLHDGRARSVWEAVLWHDGEASGARERAEALTQGEREALVVFIEGL